MTKNAMIVRKNYFLSVFCSVLVCTSFVFLAALNVMTGLGSSASLFLTLVVIVAVVVGGGGGGGGGSALDLRR